MDMSSKASERIFFFDERRERCYRRAPDKEGDLQWADYQTARNEPFVLQQAIEESLHVSLGFRCVFVRPQITERTSLSRKMTSKCVRLEKAGMDSHPIIDRILFKHALQWGHNEKQ